MALKYKFRMVNDSSDEALKAHHPRIKEMLENETLVEKIGRDIDLLVGCVLSQIHLAQERRGISDDTLNEDLAYLQKCIDDFVEDESIQYDLTISTMLKYAVALGGDLKISIEFPDGESAELL